MRADLSCAKILVVSQKTPKKNYTPEPEIPSELRDRYLTIMEVLTGLTSVSEGARRLSLSRNHFQTLLHKAQESMIDGITPKPAGRPAKSEEMIEMQEKVKRLEKENAQLRDRVETIDRLLGVAGDLLKGRELTSPRASRTKNRSKSTGSGDVEEPEKRARTIVEKAEVMRRDGVAMPTIAVVVGVPSATLWRWLRRARKNEVIVRGRGRQVEVRPIAMDLVHRAKSLVNELRGLVGADALRRSVPGLSRRTAAKIKQVTLTERERERKLHTRRVLIAHPGVVRGFDGVYVATTRGPREVLIAADAAVPFRTSALVTEHYNDSAVARALIFDFERHGIPLVLRLDRASCHRTPKIRELLKRFGVLVLHGPPRYPRFYGQLERQNREHRAWLDAAGILEPEELELECARMIEVLSTKWPRRALDWDTPAERWNARPPLSVDRKLFVEEVQQEVQRELVERSSQRRDRDDVDRIAIERVLKRHNYLRYE